MQSADTIRATGAVDFDVWGNIRSGASPQLGWSGELRDAATGQVHLRARDYSPGTVRITSRDTLVPNASGTNGYNPYWYANDNPATLTDPTGHNAATTLNPNIFAPIAKAVLRPFVVAGQALARVARAATSNPRTALLWAGAAFLLVAAILTCILTPLCHQAKSVVTGRVIDAVEEVKIELPDDLFTAAALYIVVSQAAECLSHSIKNPERCAPDPDCEMRSYTKRNFRPNLACFTRIFPPLGPLLFEAHHVFPQKFRKTFAQVAGMGSIHQPQYGWWAWIADHWRINHPYNQRWRTFFADRDPSSIPLPEVLQEGRDIMRFYGYGTFF